MTDTQLAIVIIAATKNDISHPLASATYSITAPDMKIPILNPELMTDVTGPSSFFLNNNSLT
jgi:hypothetical protein